MKHSVHALPLQTIQAKSRDGPAGRSRKPDFGIRRVAFPNLHDRAAVLSQLGHDSRPTVDLSMVIINSRTNLETFRAGCARIGLHNRTDPLFYEINQADFIIRTSVSAGAATETESPLGDVLHVVKTRHKFDGFAKN